MDKRNTPLTPGHIYMVVQPNGKHFRVFSEEGLQRMKDRGELTDEHRVVLQRSNTL